MKKEKINRNDVDPTLAVTKKEQKEFYKSFVNDIKEAIESLPFDLIQLEYKNYITTNRLNDYFIEFIQEIFER